MSISSSPPLLASSASAKPTHHMHPHASTTSISGHHQHQQRSPIQQHHTAHTHHHLQPLSHSSSPNMIPREASLQASPSSQPTASTASTTAVSLSSSSNSLASLSSMLANTLQENELLRADLTAALNRAAKAERLVKAFQSAASSGEDSCNKSSSAGTGTGNVSTNSPSSGTKINDNPNNKTNNDGYDISQCGYLSEKTVNIIMDYDERLERSERSQEYLHQKLHSLMSSWSELERYLSLIELRAQDARMIFGRDVVAQFENGIGAFRFGLGNGFGESSGGGAVVGAQRDKDRDYLKDSNGQGLRSSLPPIQPPPSSATLKHPNNVSTSSLSFGSLTLPPIFPGSNLNSVSGSQQMQSRPDSSHLLPPSPFAHNQSQRNQYEHASSGSQRRSHYDSLQQQYPQHQNQHHSHPPPLQLQPLHGASQQSSAPNTGSGYWTSAPNAFQALPLPPPPSATVGPNPSSKQGQSSSGANVLIGQKRSYDDVTGVNPDMDPADEIDATEMQIIRQGRKRSRRERGMEYSSSPIAGGQLQQRQLYTSQSDVDVNGNGMMQVSSATNGNGNARQHMYANPPVSRERTIILAQQQIQNMVEQERDVQARVSRHKEKSSSKNDGLPVNGQPHHHHHHSRGRDASKDTRRVGRGRSLSVSSQAESVVSSTSTMSIDEMLLAASGSGGGESNNTQSMMASSNSMGARSGSKRPSPSSSSQLHHQTISPAPYNANVNGNQNSNERLQVVRPDPHIGPHREPPSVSEYQVHIFAEPVTASVPPPQSLSGTSSNSTANKQRNKPVSVSTASQARRSRSITSERSVPASTSLPTLPPNPNPPPNVTILPSGFYPATNDLGQRICRQCGVAGRYKDGKCVEKWGPGPEGPGTVCDRCRKKMKRIARLENNEPLSFSQSQRSTSQSLSQTLSNKQQQQPSHSKSQGLRQTQSIPAASSRSSLNSSQSLPLQGGVKKKSTSSINKATVAVAQLPLKRHDTVVSSESQESVDARQVTDRRPVMTPPYITSISTKEQHASVGSRGRESDDEEDLDAEAEVEDDTQVNTNNFLKKGSTQQQRRESGGHNLLSPRTSNVRTPPSANDSMLSADAEAEPDPSHPIHVPEVQTHIHHTSTAIPSTLLKDSQGKEDVDDVDADADAEAENELDVDEEIVNILPATKYSNTVTEKLSVPPLNETSRSRSPSNVSNRASKDTTTISSAISTDSSQIHSQIPNTEKGNNLPVLPSIHTAVNGVMKMPSVRGEVKAESS